MNYLVGELQKIKFGRSLFGYNSDKVKIALRWIIDDYKELEAENRELKKQLKAISDSIEQYRLVEISLRNALVVAHQAADEIRRDAQEKAESIIKETESTCLQLENESIERVMTSNIQYESIRKEVRVFKENIENLFLSQVENFRKSAEEILNAEISEMPQRWKHDDRNGVLGVSDGSKTDEYRDPGFDSDSRVEGPRVHAHTAEAEGGEQRAQIHTAEAEGGEQRAQIHTARAEGGEQGFQAHTARDEGSDLRFQRAGDDTDGSALRYQFSTDDSDNSGLRFQYSTKTDGKHPQVGGEAAAVELLRRDGDNSDGGGLRYQFSTDDSDDNGLRFQYSTELNGQQRKIGGEAAAVELLRRDDDNPHGGGLRNEFSTDDSDDNGLRFQYSTESNGQQRQIGENTTAPEYLNQHDDHYEVGGLRFQCTTEPDGQQRQVGKNEREYAASTELKRSDSEFAALIELQRLTGLVTTEDMVSAELRRQADENTMEEEQGRRSSEEAVAAEQQRQFGENVTEAE